MLAFCAIFEPENASNFAWNTDAVTACTEI